MLKAWIRHALGKCESDRQDAWLATCKEQFVEVFQLLNLYACMQNASNRQCTPHITITILRQAGQQHQRFINCHATFIRKENLRANY